MTTTLQKKKADLLLTEWREIRFQNFEEKALGQQLLEETLYACEPPVHERKRPTYGAILVSSKPGRILVDEPQHIINIDLSDARKLSDGIFSFVVRAGNQTQLRVLRTHFGDEYSAYSIRDEFLSPFSIHELPAWDIGLVQRTGEGEIRVLGPRNIALQSSGKWMVKDYKYSYVEGIDLSSTLKGEEVVTIREVVPPEHRPRFLCNCIP